MFFVFDSVENMLKQQNYLLRWNDEMQEIYFLRVPHN